MCVQGDYVWIEPITKGEWDVPKAGKVLGETHKQLKIVDDDGQVSFLTGIKKYSNVIKT